MLAPFTSNHRLLFTSYTPAITLNTFFKPSDCVLHKSSIGILGSTSFLRLFSYLIRIGVSVSAASAKIEYTGSEILKEPLCPCLKPVGTIVTVALSEPFFISISGTPEANVTLTSAPILSCRVFSCEINEKPFNSLIKTTIINLL